ncbi:NAD-dependent epimerase/dehydratase family protein [Rhodoferax ferrireducens]|uniref:NAD-dependent epimerase/dehydratase family protein n=1 Tax=Rhodoferax ferrireducens TaxID=192843 RepID=UPI000E0CCE39|nr:NAD-dependent epimerase/dehydratase family protein [Rhodoferax ferrireducens]
MNIFITGASGYIGGSVAAALIKRGHKVRGLTRSPSVAEQLESYGIDPVMGSLDDFELLMEQASKSDAIINTANADHLAAVEALIAGLKGTGKVLIHTSGSSIIGDDARGDFCSGAVYSEDTPLVVDARKKARRNIDLLVIEAYKLNVRSSVIIPSLIYGYGTGINKSSIQIPFMVNNALEQDEIQIVGKGLNTWSNVHIDDLVDLYCLTLEGAPAGSFYFAENGEASFLDIAKAISERLNINKIAHLSPEVAVEKWGMARALFTLGSNSRVRSVHAHSDLDWKPKHASVQKWILDEMKTN